MENTQKTQGQPKAQVPAETQTTLAKDTGQARPIVNEPVEREMSLSEKLIKERLSEYARAVSGASVPSARKNEYLTLHAAFRTLMSARGDEFLNCFKVFIRTMREAREGKDGMKPSAFSANVVGYNLNLFSDTNEGRAFIAFMVLASSYARTKNNANFVREKNIDRLLNMLGDEELKKIVVDAFSGK